MAQETGYRVIYKNVNDVSWTEVAVYPPDTVTSVIDSLTSGDTYQIAVQAVGDGSNVADSAFSNVLEITTYIQLDAVTLTDEWSQPHKFRIEWTDPNAPEIIEKYEVHSKLQSDTEWWIQDTTNLFFEITSEPGETYEYFVRVIPHDSNLYLTADTAIQTITTTTNLIAPTLSSVIVNGDNTFSLIWTDPNTEPYNDYGTSLEYQRESDPWTEEFRTLPDETEYTTSAMSLAGEYCWRVKARGNFSPMTDSAYSNIICAAIHGFLPTPLLAGPWTIGNTEVSGTYTYDAGAVDDTEFLIGQYKKSTDDTWIDGPQITPAASGLLTFTGLEVYTEYDFRMYATSSEPYYSDSAYSTVSTWRTTVPQPAGISYAFREGIDKGDLVSSYSTIIDSEEIEYTTAASKAHIKITMYVQTPGGNDWDVSWDINAHIDGQTAVRGKGQVRDGRRGSGDTDYVYKLPVYIEFIADLSGVAVGDLKISAEVKRTDTFAQAMWRDYYIQVTYLN